MNNTELRMLHSNLLIIMDEIDRICKKHGIVYSLHSGSLLGAVRHGGFIPWDDDMDIAMLRKDYDRFFKICETELDPRFGTITIEKDPNYFYGMAKVVLHGTKVRQLGLNKGEGTSELWIDIFPYDYISSGKLQRLWQAVSAQLFIKLLEEREDGLSENTSFAKRAYFFGLKLINMFVKESWIKKSLLRAMRKYSGNESGEICCICGFGYKRQILPNDFFDHLKEYAFEEKRLTGFADADYYLTRVFGDYMTLPPVEQRETHNLEIISLHQR